jgi:pyruvate/2-oxoglutarate dehydrogenase complex dihydrolipoamide dehydrogenase (E3) component
LVLSPGAAPIRPPLPGVDSPGVFAVRTIPDSRRIRSWISDHNAKHAVVVGGGFIGLEMVENLIHRELGGDLEKFPSHAALGPKWQCRHEHLAGRVQPIWATGWQALKRAPAADWSSSLKAAQRLPADLVILAIGVRPETGLAKMRPQIGPRGGIASMRRCALRTRISGRSGTSSKCKTCSRVKKRCCRWRDRRIAKDALPPSRSPDGERVSAACRRPRWSACSV